jgi:hypothetical protein
VTPLERGQLWVMRIHGAIASAVLLAAGTVGGLVLQEQELFPLAGALAPLVAVAIYLVFISPGRRYAAWSYALDQDDLRIGRGVWTQVSTMVPLDRVQHLDIAQGPIERAFSVCRLVLHTAGTLHSQVTLPGLTRETAERMRDEIRARVQPEPQ